MIDNCNLVFKNKKNIKNAYQTKWAKEGKWNAALSVNTEISFLFKKNTHEVKP